MSKCLFHRSSMIERLFAETSVVELTADARLPTAGAGSASDRTLRRMRFGIGSAGALLPLAAVKFGLPLRAGRILVGVAAVGGLPISCLKSLTTISSALR